MSPQEQMERRKRKKEAKLEFSPEKVFNVEPAEDLSLDIETARYKAVKGQGGDRRG